jgi:DNA-binding protein HU-beta
MNKQDLIAHVATAAGLSKVDAKKAIESYHEAVATTLKAGNKVDILGFGSFSVASRPARTGRNPKTGEALQIKAAKLPKFKPGKGLKDAIA